MNEVSKPLTFLGIQLGFLRLDTYVLLYFATSKYEDPDTRGPAPEVGTLGLPKSRRKPGSQIPSAKAPGPAIDTFFGRPVITD